MVSDSSSEGIERFIQPHLQRFGGYVSSKAPEKVAAKAKIAIEDIIKLDGNENPYGCSPRVYKALAEYPFFNIYADSTQTELRRLLSEYTGIAPEYLVGSAGSDQLIELVTRLFVGLGDEVINAVPTFDIFRFATQLANGKLVEVLRNEDYTIDVAAIKRSITKNTKLIILANPNNPTGTAISEKDMMELVDTGLPMVADEAYVEFSGRTLTREVSKHKNLIVLRTFSKWAGLAGMRIGYGIFPPRIAQYLMTVKLPFNVSAAAVVAVRETLKDLDNMMAHVKAIVTERERLHKELAKLSWLKPMPSSANFIFCHVLKGNASQIQQALQEKGILIRYFDLPYLQNSLRIGVGKPQHTDATIKALKQEAPK
jgi:histidinol-phosphate aminotransferase